MCVQAAARRKHGGAPSDAPATLAVVGAGRGVLEQPVLMPPAWQCLEWVHELEALLARELLLKTALVDGLAHDAPLEHAQQTVQLWRLQPNLGRAPLERLQALVGSLTLGPAQEHGEAEGAQVTK